MKIPDLDISDISRQAKPSQLRSWYVRGPFSGWTVWEWGSSSTICLLGLERICELVEFQAQKSSCLKWFLTLRIISEIHWICRCYQPLLWSSLPPPTFLKHLLGIYCVEFLVKGWWHETRHRVLTACRQSRWSERRTSHTQSEQPVGRAAPALTPPRPHPQLSKIPLLATPNRMAHDSGWLHMSRRWVLGS